MKLINNKNGIKMYYEISKDICKVNILDSKGHYFNDLLYEPGYAQEDIKSIIQMLEETKLDEMCLYFGVKFYESLENLKKSENLDQTLKEIETNDYTNIFVVNDKKYYTWSW